MAFKADDFRAGQILSAKSLSALAVEVERLGKVAISPPLTLADDAGGLLLGIDLAEPWDVKLTSGGTGGKYAWTRQKGATGGTWADHPSGRTGTVAADPAYEVNGNATVPLSPNPVVRAWRDPVSHALLFQSGSC